MTDLSRLLNIANEAVDIGREAAVTQDLGTVTSKGDRDMASEVDFAVEHAIRSHLAKATPEIEFLGEEEGRSGDDSGGLLWVLDPIDGTANFVHGIPLVAISLGLVAGDSSLVGVIDMPFLSRRYAGCLGSGSYCNGRQIHGSKCSRLEDAIIAIGDYAVGDNSAERNAPRLALTSLLAAQIQRIRMLGTAATDLAWVADGSLDASIMFNNKPWDTSAGVLIAREAGAQVLDVDGMQHTFHSAGTVAVVTPLVSEVMGLIAEAQEAQL
ncbi:inositol monophosphatase family protein [Kribbella sp. VKM Ac-2566]|uniref:inositol monophosphatase family protein n=1 Tax=Kribbella sp. VKM Ac-2566 TaxID=2512218 RepID=UPI001063E183|nr:inositol monophosphatase family protein [Kribbella sp. VKM Ac-2566]TDW88792.1 myo-inositol-1(or 4)-monophosphatase [Kribbella sp. VKM Ac-2566]